MSMVNCPVYWIHLQSLERSQADQKHYRRLQQFPCVRVCGHCQDLLTMAARELMDRLT